MALGVALESKKFSCQSRPRHLQNGAHGKLFDRRQCAITLQLASSTSDKKMDCEKSNMAELRSIEFLACGRISMRQAYPFVTAANDFQWRGAPIASELVAHYGIGNDRPDSSF
jgi:hypothetical protein